MARRAASNRPPTETACTAPVAAVKLFGFEYTPVADDEDEGGAGAPGSGKRFPGEDSLTGRVAGNTEAPCGASLPRNLPRTNR